MKKLHVAATALIMSGTISSLTYSMNAETILRLQVAITQDDKTEAETAIRSALQSNVDLKRFNMEIFDLDYPTMTEGVSLLAAAAQKGNVNVIKLLIDLGKFDVDDIDKNKISGHTPLMFAAAKGHLEAVRALVDAGANVDLVSKEGKTALEYAREKNHQNIIDSLLGKKPVVDTNVKEKPGYLTTFYKKIFKK